MLNRLWPAMLVADGVQQKHSLCFLCIHSDEKQLPHTLMILNLWAFGEVVCRPCFSCVCVFSFKITWAGLDFFRHSQWYTSLQLYNWLSCKVVPAQCSLEQFVSLRLRLALFTANTGPASRWRTFHEIFFNVSLFSFSIRMARILFASRSQRLVLFVKHRSYWKACVNKVPVEEISSCVTRNVGPWK